MDYGDQDNPFAINNGQGSQQHRLSPYGSSNAQTLNDRVDKGAQLEELKAIKARKRSHSLRTQLFNKNIYDSTFSGSSSDLNTSSSPSNSRSSNSYATDHRLVSINEPDTTYTSSDIELFKIEPEGNNFLGEEVEEDFQESVRYDPRSNYTATSSSSQFKRSKIKAIYSFTKRFLGIDEPLPSVGGRNVPLTFDITASVEPYQTNPKTSQKLLVDARTQQPYVNNVITSSKYTVFSFIPRQLYAQFSKLANTYFMCVAIMQLIPSWSTTGTTTTIIPLSIFITISILREGFDDLRRHRLDKDENNRYTTVLSYSNSSSMNDMRMNYRSSFATSSTLLRVEQSFDEDYADSEDEEDDSFEDDRLNYFNDGVPAATSASNSFADDAKLRKYRVVPTRTRWKNVKVGDIVRLRCDEWVPADMILLTSSNELGEAFIETMALDGETNLKSKSPNPEIHAICNKAKKLSNINASILSEDPNLDLYNFEGSLSMPSPTTNEKKIYPLGPDNVVYRGSILRNTDFALGLVIFTGEETKIRMNAIKNPRIKAPKLQRSINMIVLFMVIVVLSLSAFSTMAERLNFDKQKSRTWYLYGEDAGVAATFMGFIIMFNTMIPLSLYVTMEIIKVMQMLLLQWDLDMYHLESNTPAEARTATILEELGQVSYIFTDKTGTLTDNIMIFRKFSIAGTAWIHDIDILGAEMEGHVGRSRDGSFDQSELHRARSTSPNGRIRYTGRPSMATLKSSASQQHNSILQPGAPYRNGDSSNGRHQQVPRPSFNPSLVTANTWKSQLHQQEQNIENGDSGTTPKIRSSLELIEYLQSDPPGLFAKKAKFFLLTLALCHTCLPKHVEKRSSDVDNDDSMEIESIRADDGDTRGDMNGNTRDLVTRVDTNDSSDDDIDYQASSPDELALVQAASDMGYVVYDKKQKKMTLKTYPKGFDEEPVIEIYTILDVVDFTSSRKRMSVVVEFPDGKLCMICKGADNIILERLRNSEMVQDKQRELVRNVSQRKKTEADYVLTRNSMDSSRPSISSIRQSLNFSPTNPVSPPLSSSLATDHSSSGNIDSVLLGGSSSTTQYSGPDENKVHELMEQSRRSFQLKQEQRYGDLLSMNRHNYIPSDQLVLNDEYVLEKTLAHIDEFSTEGLRTLMYAHKWLDRKTYNEWAEKYAAAKTSLVDRAKKIEQIGALLEDNLELTGATAIEDKLQLGVPDAIEGLRRAGIKLWMLTGDKRETAINIGHSCKLIKDYSTVVVLSNENGIDDLSTTITAADLEINAGNVAHSVIVVDGSTLADIENDTTLMTLFIGLGVKADSVICCRASPSQKASMVSNIRALDRKKVTLAIGDGANDIAMIQSADVGIGITGKEGLQAARTSDYSIAQFRYLMKLLLVHGRYNYVRTSKFVLCTFYKEMLFYLTQLLYQRYTLFTGSSLYESWSLSMFNTLFTSLPVLCIGMFEKDLRPSTLLSIPELYSKGVNYESFNLKLFIMWVLLSASQAVTLCFSLWNIYGFNATLDNTTYPLGFVLFTVLIVIINTKCNVLEMHYISKINMASWITSVVGWFVWSLLLLGLYNTKDSPIFYVKNGLTEHFGKDITLWATILCLIFIGLIIDFIFQTVRLILFKNDTDVFQQLEKEVETRKKMEMISFDYLKQSWLWKHDSTGEYEDLENQTALKQTTYKLKSFIRKGSTIPSKQTRKRASTLVNPNEPLPGSPSIVKLASTERYEEQLLPSGKIVRNRLNNGESGINGKSSRNRFNHLFKVDEDDTMEDFTNGEEIEDILERRQKQIDEA